MPDLLFKNTFALYNMTVSPLSLRSDAQLHKLTSFLEQLSEEELLALETHDVILGTEDILQAKKTIQKNCTADMADKYQKFKNNS